jgi:hypothetical protein
MGGVYTTNISNEIVQALTSVSNSASQSCVLSSEQVQLTNLNNLHHVDINIFENFNQYLVLNSACIQNVTLQNNLSQIMSQEAQQIAKSVAQQFQFGTTVAKNVSNQTADLAVQVSNSFVQNCAGYSAQIQEFNLTNSTMVTGNVYLNWEQYNASTFQCVTQDEAVNNTMQQINQTTNQQASATVENFLATIIGSIVAIFAVIFIIIFAFIYFGVGEVTSAVGSVFKPSSTPQAATQTQPQVPTESPLQLQIEREEALNPGIAEVAASNLASRSKVPVVRSTQ